MIRAKRKRGSGEDEKPVGKVEAEKNTLQIEIKNATAESAVPDGLDSLLGGYGSDDE